MFDRIVPRQIDNIYRGHRAGLWIFGLVLLMRLAMGANIMLNTRSVAQGADGIPVDSFGAAAADAVIGLFALLGLARLMTALLGLLVLVRYRAMVPFMFLLMLIEHGAGRALLLARPVVHGETAPAAFYITLILFVLLLAGLALSLWRRAPDHGS
jgi:glucan phosphoethanolaminetransferase (alkaline phosphatase superfamily)